VQAGFKANRGNASRLKANESIATRLAELQNEAAKDATVTIESLLRELEAARNQASSLNQLGAATQAIMGKAKIAGLLVQRVEERVEIGGPGDFSPDDTPEDIARGVVESIMGSDLHVLSEEEFETLAAATLQRTLDLVAAIEKFKVRNSTESPETVAYRERWAEVHARQRLEHPASPAR